MIYLQNHYHKAYFCRRHCTNKADDKIGGMRREEGKDGRLNGGGREKGEREKGGTERGEGEVSCYPRLEIFTPELPHSDKQFFYTGGRIQVEREVWREGRKEGRSLRKRRKRREQHKQLKRKREKEGIGCERKGGKG